MSTLIDFVHPNLDGKPSEDSYSYFIEKRRTYDKKEILVLERLDRNNKESLLIVGFIKEYHAKINEFGKPVSVIEPISSAIRLEVGYFLNSEGWDKYSFYFINSEVAPRGHSHASHGTGGEVPIATP